MDNGRWFRALVMGITLLICLWALHRLETRRSVPAMAPVDTTRAEKVAPAKAAVSVVDPSVYVEPLPLVAVLRAHGSPAGFAEYRVMDRHPQSDSTYEIEAVAPDGRTEWVSVRA